MARRAFSSQCWFVTAMIFLGLFATFISYPYQSSISASAKFRYGLSARDSSNAALPGDVDFDSSGNASHGLFKRGWAPRCDVETAFQFMARGCHFTNLMFATQDEVVLQHGVSAVSKFGSKDVVGAASGWKRVAVKINVDPTQHAPYLIGLDNVEGFQNFEKVSMNQAWAHSTYTQEKHYTRVRNNVAYGHEPTLAIHEQISSYTALTGVVIIINALTPKFMVGVTTGRTLPDDELPEVGLWSDIGYIEYGRDGRTPNFAPEDMINFRPQHARAAPRWFVMPAVWGPLSSLEVVSHCLFGYGLLGLPTWENRATFPIGSFCFEAILGTPHGSQLAWFLISHKYRLNDVTLASVTIYGSGVIGLDGYELPSMLWWAYPTRRRSRNDVTLAQIRAENTAYSLEQGKDMRQMPYMLKPAY